MICSWLRLPYRHIHIRLRDIIFWVLQCFLLHREYPATKCTRVRPGLTAVWCWWSAYVDTYFRFWNIIFRFFSPPSWDRTRTRNNDRGQNAGQLSAAVGPDAGRIFHTRSRAGRHPGESRGRASVAGRFGRRRERQEQGNRCDPSRRARRDRRAETG